MQSFLAYIASQYGRKREDVATDFLAYLLNRYRPARAAFGQFLTQFGSEVPNRYSAKSRTKGANGAVGIPDVQIVDADEKCFAIVENKFEARLTSKQPIDYFTCFKEEIGGLILFVVPHRRIGEIWDKVLELCEKNERPLQPLDGRYFGKTGKDRLKVVSWDELLEYMKRGITVSLLGTNQTAATVFIEQLKELCDVAEEERIEPLEGAELSNRDIGRRIWSYSRLTKAIAEDAHKEQCFLPESEKDQNKLGASGLGFEGLYGKMAGYRAWIGFAPEYWAKHGTSPLWIAFDGENEVEALAEKSKDLIASKSCFLIPPEDCDVLAFPLSLKPDIEQESVIDDAVRQLREIRNRFSDEPITGQ